MGDGNIALWPFMTDARQEKIIMVIGILLGLATLAYWVVPDILMLFITPSNI